MTPDNSPTLEIAERIALALERIAESLELLSLAIDTVTDDEGEETNVLNIWKEGENE